RLLKSWGLQVLGNEKTLPPGDGRVISNTRQLLFSVEGICERLSVRRSDAGHVVPAYLRVQGFRIVARSPVKVGFGHVRAIASKRDRERSEGVVRIVPQRADESSGRGAAHYLVRVVLVCARGFLNRSFHVVRRSNRNDIVNGSRGHGV